MNFNITKTIPENLYPEIIEMISSNPELAIHIVVVTTAVAASIFTKYILAKPIRWSLLREYTCYAWGVVGIYPMLNFTAVINNCQSVWSSCTFNGLVPGLFNETVNFDKPNPFNHPDFIASINMLEFSFVAAPVLGFCARKAYALIIHN